MIRDVSKDIDGETYRFRMSAAAATDIKRFITSEVEKRYDLDEVIEDEAQAEKQNARIKRAVARISENNITVIFKILMRHNDGSVVPSDEADRVIDNLDLEEMTKIIDEVSKQQMPKESKKKTDKKAKPAKN